MTPTLRAEVVICGAGIAGVSAAYFLAAKYGVTDLILVEKGAPLSLTSDQSTECYRNWWPGPDDAMVHLMNRSIDLLEELADASNNAFHLNRRGYLYCTTDLAKVPGMYSDAKRISHQGAGPLRVHTQRDCEPLYRSASAFDYRGQPDGADLLLNQSIIQENFPYLSPDVLAVLHVRRAGWLSAQQLGMLMLEEIRRIGVRVLNEEVTGVELKAGRIHAVTMASGFRVETPAFVNAAGPMLKDVGNLLQVDLPVYNELHLKVNFKDSEGILDRNAPLVIYTDPQILNWTEEERQLLEDDEEYRWLLDELPGGVHTRPEGSRDSQMILVLWEYNTRPVEAVFPAPVDPQYPEFALRGLSRLIPGMEKYLGKFTKPHVDGGYYTRTKENRPLVGGLPLPGAYVIGAMAGYGIMAACGAADLLARHITGIPLPRYAPSFSLNRYNDPQYLKLFLGWEDTGQL